MSTSHYLVGTQVRIAGYFTGFDGQPASPTTVRLRVLDPSDNETAPAVTDNTNPEDGTTAETGTYFGDVILTEAGDWCWRWEGDGDIEAADEGIIRVSESKFGSPS